MICCVFIQPKAVDERLQILVQPEANDRHHSRRDVHQLAKDRTHASRFLCADLNSLMSSRQVSYYSYFRFSLLVPFCGVLILELLIPLTLVMYEFFLAKGQTDDIPPVSVFRLGSNRRQQRGPYR